MLLEDAVKAGKKYVTTAIEHGIALGKGNGPTHHFVDLYKKAGIFEL
jgi:hydroxymethylpyrimidine/phosphomethylpyrimidine kinase